MRTLTISRRIALGFALVVLIAACASVYSLNRLRIIEVKTTRMQKESLPGLGLSVQIENLAKDIVFAAANFVIVSNPVEREQLFTEVETNHQRTESLFNDYEKTVDSPRDRELFEEMKRVRLPYFAAIERVKGLVQEGKVEAAARYFDDDLPPVATKYTQAIQALVDLNRSDTDGNAQDVSGFVAESKIVSLIAFGVSFAAAIFISFWIVRAIKKPVEQINTAIQQIAATMKEQQATSGEVASTTVEIGATAKEISATSKELVKTIGDVATVAEKSSRAASDAQEGLNRMDGTMRQIINASATISSKLGLLNEKASNISSVVTTINKIADQTNLLSLNAAIEAERAGEHGRGFSVVATETRRLADQTAVATYDLEQMVKEIQLAVAAGVMGMDKFNEEVRKGTTEVAQVTGQLGEIIEQVTALTPRFELVNEGMQTQSTGSQQITEALTQLSETAQQTTEALRNSNQAIERLSDASRGLTHGPAQRNGSLIHK